MHNTSVANLKVFSTNFCEEQHNNPIRTAGCRSSGKKRRHRTASDDTFRPAWHAVLHYSRSDNHDDPLCSHRISDCRHRPDHFVASMYCLDRVGNTELQPPAAFRKRLRSAIRYVSVSGRQKERKNPFPLQALQAPQRTIPFACWRTEKMDASRAEIYP